MRIRSWWTPGKILGNSPRRDLPLPWNECVPSIVDTGKSSKFRRGGIFPSRYANSFLVDTRQNPRKFAEAGSSSPVERMRAKYSGHSTKSSEFWRGGMFLSRGTNACLVDTRENPWKFAEAGSSSPVERVRAKYSGHREILEISPRPYLPLP
jgi:hypothetical protein